MSKIPPVGETLALLESLKQAVRDFAAREEKLNTDLQNRSTAALSLFETKNTQLDSDRVGGLEDAEATLETERIECQSRFEKRQQQINRAHENARTRIAGTIENRDTQWRSRFQTGLTANEKQRDQELADLDAGEKDFKLKFSGAEDVHRQLERKAHWTFRAGGKFRRLLHQPPQASESILPPYLDEFFTEFERLQIQTEDQLNQFQRNSFPRLFKFIPFWPLAVLLLAAIAAYPVCRHFNSDLVTAPESVIALVVLLVLSAGSFAARRAIAPTAGVVADYFLKMRRMLGGGFEKIESHFHAERERIENEFKGNQHALNQQWKEGTRDLTELSYSAPTQTDEKAYRLHQKNSQYLQDRLARIKTDYDQIIAQLKAGKEGQAQHNLDTYHANQANLEKEFQAGWAVLEMDWRKTIQPLCDELERVRVLTEQKFPEWTAANWEQWMPPKDFQNVAKFARLEIDVARFVETLPQDQRLSLPCPATLSVPLSLVCPAQGSLLFEAGKTGDDEAIASINNIIFRLFATTPPGKLSVTIFDPVGLGQNFASLMHLADYEESYINSRIWTQSAQFEEKLAELNEHMEKIIQMYLRNDYATITEYNAEAGAVAEKYHFLVIASFPANFSETASRRLRNIAASGARCGVYTLIHWDSRIALPQEFVPDELRKSGVCLVRSDKGFEISGWRPPGVRLLLDTPPADDFVTHFLQQIGRTSKDSTRVEVPFDQVAPSDADLWKEETTEELRVPIGRSGATKFQYLAIGKGTRQHALIAGKTGSGKSTLFHIIITNLALRCSPEQVEFYLVDFKKGVEFKCYAARKLPHAKVVAIESDREFGLSVLQRVDDELRRRGDLFRKLGAQDLAGYKRAGGTEPIPRTLLIIDEFQEFFVEEDRVSQGAAVLLDRIVRQGRAFGIHVLLGSQTLGGAYTLARATIGQMVIRIALQCNEADAYLIMDQDNPAPRLLSRPGEGIYNDAAGSIEGNSPFQAVWLPDTVRDAALKKIREHADQTKYPGPIVFEGNAPAEVRDNLLLRAALASIPPRPPAQALAWLGAPNSIKGPTEAVFQKLSGNNLLIVGQSDERTLTLLLVSLVSLAAQYPRGAARFIVLDSTPDGVPQRELLERVIAAIPHEVTLVGNSNLSEILSPLADELKKRGEKESASAPETFILIQGLQNFKKLRQEDEFSFSSSGSETVFNPATALLNFITEGPSHGIHVIATCDTYNNVNRFLGRKALSEFEMRVVFQMSASDSASLIDAPNASTLGLHRALYYNEREGRLETFRPYAQPDNGWIEEVGRQLAQSKSAAK